MNVEEIPNIPRIYTALAEWLACLIVVYPALRKHWQRSYLPAILLSGCGQILLQLFAGKLAVAYVLWIPGMILNIVWMYSVIYFFTRISWENIIFLCSKAFILAEFTAAFAWQLYYQFFFQANTDVQRTSKQLLMLFFLLFMLSIFLLIEMRVSASQQQLFGEVRKKEAYMALLTALIVFTFSNSGFWLPHAALQKMDVIGIFSTRSFINLSGVCILYLQEIQGKEDYLKRELSAIQQVFQTQYQQYEAYKENSDLVNRKFHDLKHQIDVIRNEKNQSRKEQYLNELERSIVQFSSPVETGNPVLDTILTRKNFYCLEHNIKLTCLVDGTLLTFMSVMDICSLFGNALDNAIESVEHLSNPDQRLIQLKVHEKNGFILIRLENFSGNPVRFLDGVPQTTKADKQKHGYGIKSISHTAACYDGTMTLTNTDNWFILTILFPKKNLV